MCLQHFVTAKLRVETKNKSNRKNLLKRGRGREVLCGQQQIKIKIKF